MNHDFEIFRQADRLSALADAGEHLNNYLAENKKRPILLMLSGGSCLEMLEYLSPSSLGENITVSMLDERFSMESDVNNFAQMQKLDFYNVALEAECSFFGTLPRAGETPQDLQKRWDANLKNWREQNPNGITIATLGMGADGHTAGIFPFDNETEFKKIFTDDTWTVAYNVGEKSQHPERLTTTPAFFKLIDFAVAFVVGQEKREKLETAIKNQGDVYEVPALAWHEIKEVKVFTDIK